jgi:hypothetical protein
LDAESETFDGWQDDGTSAVNVDLLRQYAIAWVPEISDHRVVRLEHMMPLVVAAEQSGPLFLRHLALNYCTEASEMNAEGDQLSEDLADADSVGPGTPAEDLAAADSVAPGTPDPPGTPDDFEPSAPGTPATTPEIMQDVQ